MSVESKPAKQRLDCIDALRGLVMVFMCLDHSREYFSNLFLDPEDLNSPDVILFFTRWITHFCAPAFVFLAGIGAWFYGNKRGSRGELAWFLVTRGLWLIVLEFTVVHFAWTHGSDMIPFMFIVIAAIGSSMIALAGLIFLPYRLLLMFSLIIIVGHNCLDQVSPEDLGSLSWVWVLAHEGGALTENVNVGYPLLAWVGVISAGYCFGHILQLDRTKRRRYCFQLGATCICLFVVLRTFNLYGDPSQRLLVDDPVVSVLSFLKCRKYPPSLHYLLMTLGPVLIVLGFLDYERKVDALRFHDRVLLAFGRVPLFFYVAHLYLIHCGSRLLYWAVCGVPHSSLLVAHESFATQSPPPETYGFPLSVAYAAWIIILALLWPCCLWFGRVKRNGRSVIWSYL